MNEKVIGECSKNPRQTGHCMHQSTTNTTAGGIVLNERCCWCGYYKQHHVRLPEHGSFSP